MSNTMRNTSVTGQGIRANSVPTGIAPADSTVQSMCYVSGMTPEEALLSSIYAKAAAVRSLVQAAKDKVIEPPSGMHLDPKALALSDAGRKFLISLEDVKKRPYVPKTPDKKTKVLSYVQASGVTVGVGYDMGSRGEQSVKDDLVAAGVDDKTATALSKGAGLKGDKAGKFAEDNAGLAITDDQAGALLNRIAGTYAGYVYRAVTHKISQGQFDALFCLAFNSPASVRKVAGPLNKGEWIGAADVWLGLTPSIVTRRRKEVYYFLKAF